MKNVFSIILSLMLSISLNAQKLHWVPDHSNLPFQSERSAAPVAHRAQAADEPIITIYTNRYQTYGADNNFQFCVLASTKVKSTEIEVDFGFGRKKYTVSSTGVLKEDEDNEVITGGTMIAGKVSPAGIVRVYGDAGKIDYFDCHGSEVYDIDLSRMTALVILELGHNEIKKLDLTKMSGLQYVDVKDNPFTNGLYLGEHKYLQYLNVNQIGDHALDHCAGVLDITRYPYLNIFTAWDAHCLKSIDPTQCPRLRQISVDNTGLSTLDVSKDTALMILNISDTRINSIDLSQNKYLVEFYAANEGQMDPAAKFNTIDFSHNPYLQRIFLDGNNLTTLDVSHQRNLVSLYASNNKLTSIKGVDVEKEPVGQRADSLAYLDLSGNCLTFATLPMTDPLTYFYYDLQQELPTAKEYSVGKKACMDLGPYILRKGTNSIIEVVSQARDGFSYGDYLIEDEDYIYNEETGIVEFLKPQTDSVQIAIANMTFTDCVLLTRQCLVRSEADYGTPVQLFTIEPAMAGDIAFSIATDVDETIWVDYGDGKRQSQDVKGGKLNEFKGKATGTVTVFGHVNTYVRNLAIKDQKLKDVDLSLLTYIHHLSIVNCGLKTIDLAWCHMLRSLDLSDNAIDVLDLNGDNDAFNKNLLTDLNVSGNNMALLELGDAAATFVNVDASRNRLNELELIDTQNLKKLNVAHNKLKELNLYYCYALTHLDASYNQLSTVNSLGVTSIKELNVAGNKFDLVGLDTLSTHGAKLIYAPQAAYTISPVAININLSAQANLRGQATQFVWRFADTKEALVEGTDYTIKNGKTAFTKAVEGKRMYCELTNAAYPDFKGENVFRTTVTEAIGQPKYTIAEFTTPKGGEVAHLSLASTKPDTYIYIDWGDANLREYKLKETYTLFENDTTIAGADVRVYSNVAENGNMGVFSVTGVTMQNVDVTRMTDVFCLTLSGAGLSEINLKGMTITELNLEGNKLKTIDLSDQTELQMLILSSNGMTDFTLYEDNVISWFTAANNKLKNIDDKPLEFAFNIDLSHNELTGFDISKFGGVTQLFLSHNKLHELDLSSRSSQLVALDISYNQFDMSTLPNPEDVRIFYYGNQAMLDVKCEGRTLDLRSQAEPWGIESDFYFFVGAINLYEDENGELQLGNEELIEGIDFTNNHGLITFKESHQQLTGLIQNELYPNILLYTNLFSVDWKQGIEDASVDYIGADGAVYNVLGQRVNETTPGIIIRNGQKYMRW